MKDNIIRFPIKNYDTSMVIKMGYFKDKTKKHPFKLIITAFPGTKDEATISGCLTPPMMTNLIESLHSLSGDYEIYMHKDEEKPSE